MNELEQYLTQLGQAHGFTLEHLEANRQGRIHAEQVSRSKGRGGPITAIVFTVLSAVGGSVGAFLYYDDARKPLARLDRNALVGILGATVLVTLFFLAIAVSSVRARKRRVAAFEAGRVEVLSGPVVKKGVQGRGGNPGAFHLHFGDRRFWVLRQTWELVTHGATYRAYVVNDQLLSLEPVAR
ncbi:MAG: hypothetical protein JNJ54_15745 [Myxococcaceae bacterium]|nr:hypothetical protein [Myxococcaceae bacterium]